MNLGCNYFTKQIEARAKLPHNVKIMIAGCAADKNEHAITVMLNTDANKGQKSMVKFSPARFNFTTRKWELRKPVNVIYDIRQIFLRRL